MDYLQKEEVSSFIKKFHNNPKKWIRLRQTNSVTTIAVKHILADDSSGLQQMLETEIEVPSIEEANKYLIDVFVPNFNKRFAIDYKKFSSAFTFVAAKLVTATPLKTKPNNNFFTFFFSFHILC